MGVNFLCSEKSEKKRKGHGRYSSDDYTGAETININHKELEPGDSCPLECGGKVYKYKEPGKVIRITGGSIVSAKRYIQEKLRCNLCGEVFTAPLPTGIVSDKKYDEAAKAVITIQKYYLGMPFHRIEDFQKIVGIPIADATLYELTEYVADSVYPVYLHFVYFAAQSQIVYQDDTPVKILSLIKENKEDTDRERTGMYTTGLVFINDGKKIHLYFSGRKHAGENLDEVLKYRDENREKIIQMSDALSANKKISVETTPCSCLVHARRKFIEILEVFDDIPEHVIEEISKIYKNDKITKVEEMTPQQRMEYHQIHSSPIMNNLKSWLNEQINNNIVESNSSLGRAIKYMLKRWTELTQFLCVPGAPLDNNTAERALKIAILNRKNAYFFKTEHGALIASINLSVIYTCIAAGENPQHYLVTLQENRQDVLLAPENWLPWNYKQQIEARV